MAVDGYWASTDMQRQTSMTDAQTTHTLSASKPTPNSAPDPSTLPPPSSASSPLLADPRCLKSTLHSASKIMSTLTRRRQRSCLLPRR